MTYKILTDDTRWIIHRSNIHLAADPNARNLHLDQLNDEPPEVIQSLRKASPALDHGEDFSLHSMESTDEHPYTESTPDPSEHPSTGDNTVIVDPQELLGRTSSCRMHFRPRVQCLLFRRSCQVLNFRQ
jgi:hypothetical protein